MTSVPPPLEARLAVDGGRAARSASFPPWPSFEEDEIRAATETLRSGRINYWNGDECRKFEAEFAERAGARYGVALMNGSVALELALHALGIGAGDEVVVPARTFIASASCAAVRGARPVFCDVDRVSQNLTAETVRAVLSPRTRAIIAVHLAGWPCDMEPILALARERGLRVIEDCAQAHGATHRGRPVGSFGDAAAFSFCTDKILTTGGEGGMLLTSDRAVWERAWSYKDHGKSWQAVHREGQPPGFRWLHESLGTNWRLTEFQAAIGRVQLSKLARWVEVRRRHAARLSARLGGLPAVRVTAPGSEAGHAYYKYYAFLRPERLRDGWDRDRVLAAIAAEGVPCFTGACPEVYLEKAFEGSGSRPAERLPVARELGATSIMFPVHPTLSDDDVETIARAAEKVLRAASR
jgi:hypothetical protein